MALTTRQKILNQIVYRFGAVAPIVTSSSRRDLENNPYEACECPAVNITLGEDDVDELLVTDEHHLQIKVELFTSFKSAAESAEDIFYGMAT